MKKRLLITLTVLALLKLAAAESHENAVGNITDAIDRLNKLATTSTIEAEIVTVLPRKTDEEIRTIHNAAIEAGTSTTVFDKTIVKAQESSSSTALRYKFDFIGMERDLVSGELRQIAMPSEDIIVEGDRFLSIVHQANEPAVAGGNLSTNPVSLYNHPLGFFLHFGQDPNLSLRIKQMDSIVWKSSKIDNCTLYEGLFKLNAENECPVYTFKLDTSNRLVEAANYGVGQCDLSANDRILWKSKLTYNSANDVPSVIENITYCKINNKNQAFITQSVNILNYSNGANANFIGNINESLSQVGTDRVLNVETQQTVMKSDFLETGNNN